MLRLIGFSCSQSPLPGHQAPTDLELGALTVLFGANDTGKSRLLGALHQALAYEHMPAAQARAVQPVHSNEQHRLRVFVHCDDLADRLTEWSGRSHPSMFEALGAERRADLAEASDPVGLLAGWLADDDPAIDPRALAASGHLVLEAVADPARDTVEYLVGWALAPEPAQPDDQPGPRWPRLPVQVAALGQVADPGLPEPVWVPQSAEGVDDRLTEAIARIGRALLALERLAAEDETDLLPRGLFGLVDVSRLQGRADQGQAWIWLQHTGGGPAGYNEDVLMAARLLSQATVRLLPSFVTGTYDIWVTLLTIADWIDSGERVAVSCRRHDDGAHFPVQGLAEGLRLWVQLALLEAIATVEVLARRVDRLAAGHPGAADRTLLECLGTLRLLHHTDAGEDELEALADELLDLLADTGPTDRAGRLYLVDEPERNLHPALARAAAPWLAQTLSARGAQALTATHSVPFLGLGPTASYSYVLRRAGRTITQRMDPDSLRATDAAAAELGLDRGELLTQMRMLLWVEGAADQAVIQALYGPRLRRAGVAVIPIHGTGRLRSIPEADALLGFTTARVVVLLDNDTEGQFGRLQLDDDFRQQVIADSKAVPELKAAASLLQSALRLDRDILARGYPARDIFFLLDAATVAGLADGYPLDHDSAWQAYQNHLQATGQKEHWKKWFARTYRLDLSIGTFAEVAARMARADRRPPALSAVVDEMCDLAKTPST